jgi:cytochrome c-type biogenesis protein CcmH/NrfG
LAIDPLQESYRLLEVSPGASPDEVRKSYLVLVNVWHPDRFAHDPELQARAQEKLKAINDAFSRLREQPSAAPPPSPPAPAPEGDNGGGAPRSPEEWLELGRRLTSNPVQLRAGEEITWSNVSNLNRHFEGMRALREALRLRPSFAAAWYSLGVAHTLLGEHQQAGKAFREALRIAPDHASAWMQLGAVEALLEKHEEVVRAFREAVRLRPGDASAWYSLGTASARLRDFEGAIEAFRRAVKLNPDLAEAWCALGVACAFPSAEGRVEPEEALVAFREAVRLKPDLTEAWYRLGATLSGLQRHDEALPALQEAVRLRPDYVDAWYSLGVASRYAKCEEARRLVRDAYGQLKRLDRDCAARLRDLLPYRLRLALLMN